MKKILACIDGSQYAESCCKHAKWAAEQLGASLELVYVTDLRQFEVPFIADLSGSLGLQPYQSIMGELQSLEEKKSEIVLDQAKEIIRADGFEGEIEKTHKTGFLVDCLGDLEENADLIVLGKRGENANFAAEHLGSTMERVVRASSRPCLVASRSFQPIERVLIAYENVDSCNAAIDFILQNPLLKGLEVHLASVSPAASESTILGDLKAAENRLTEGGFKPICQMLHGMVAQSLCDYAQEQAISMMVMGAYGHSRIRHLIIGSSTTELLRQGKLATLLFR